MPSGWAYRGTVGKWGERFAVHRLDGLYDEPRPGAPRRIGDDEITATIRLTLETQPPGAKHWSLRSMAKVIGHAPSTVHRIWQAFGLQPHRSETFRDWFAKRPRWHLHFTPTSASWINQIERFFALLTDKQLRRGVHRSTDALEEAIHAYIHAPNTEPKPFRWTKSADDIIAAINRFCLRTLGTHALQ